MREASKATKMLASLGRCCWKQVRLGKGAPDVQQKGISGNTIFFAQPTADIPSMEQPPCERPRRLHKYHLRAQFAKPPNAWWVTVSRVEYAPCV